MRQCQTLAQLARRSQCKGWATLGLLCLLASCATRPKAWTPVWRPPYGYLPIPDRLELGRARADFNAQDWSEAERRLLTLSATHPEQLDVGFALQDLRIAMWERGLWAPEEPLGQAPSIAGLGTGDEPPTTGVRLGTEGDPEREEEDDPAVIALRKSFEPLAWFYARQLTQAPSVPNLVLAARIQPNPEQAVAWLDQALALDPTCAWAHYGKAHALLRLRDQYRWRNSRESLDLALEFDPAHLHARRLEAWMLAQEGAAEPAALALERWLIASEFDPRVGRKSRVEARLDLARVWLSLGVVDPALRELQTLEGESIGRARRLLLLAVALTEKNDVNGALHAVRQATMISGVGVLPHVQEAMLREHWLSDREGALALWKEILVEAGQSSDPAVILQAFRARVVLERGQPESDAEANPAVPTTEDSDSGSSDEDDALRTSQRRDASPHPMG